MARTLDPVLHQERRDTILDATARLIAAQGFEVMTIADVLAATGISKGALYYYFAGKDELLVGLIERRLATWSAAIDSALSGVEGPQQRLVTLVRALVSAKSEDANVLLGALPQLQARNNAATFVRLRAAATQRFGPLLTEVIEDGRTSGAFRVPSAPSAAKVVLSLLQELSDCVSRGLLALSRLRSTDPAPQLQAELRADVTAFAAAIPAVLDADIDPEQIVHPDDLDIWLRRAEETR